MRGMRAAYMDIDMYSSSRDVQRFSYMIVEFYQEVQIQSAEKYQSVLLCRMKWMRIELGCALCSSAHAMTLRVLQQRPANWRLWALSPPSNFYARQPTSRAGPVFFLS